jgi:hypothetical protein
MFLSKSLWSISDGSMKSSPVVVGYLPVNSEYEMFSCLILFHISELELEFSVIGFLCTILPRRSLCTHGYENMIHLEKLHYAFTRIFWSLIRMKIFWHDSSSFCYSILDSTQYEFFCMRVTQCISHNLFGEVIKNSSKIQMYSSIDDVSKVTSPNNMRMYRAEGFQMIHYLNSSNIFPMHIILFLVTRLDPCSSFSHESRYTKFLHESTRFFHWPVEWQSNPTVSIPRMFLMNIVEFLFFIQVSYIHQRTSPEWWSSNRKYAREDTISYSMRRILMVFFVYLSHEVGLLHLFFSLAQPQCWAIR